MIRSFQRNTKSICAFVLISLIVAAGLSCYSKAVDEQLADAAFFTLSEIIYQQKFSFNTKMSEEISTMESLAALISKLSSEKEAIEDALQLVVSKTGFTQLAIVDADGQGFSSNGHSINYEDYSFFHAAMQGETTISEPYEQMPDKVKMLGIATPIYSNDHIESVLIGTYLVSTLDKLFASSFQDSGYAYIVTAKGEAIAKTTNTETQSSDMNLFTYLEKVVFDDFGIDHVSILKNVQTRKNGYTTFRLGEERYLMYYEPIDINDWYLFSIVPENVVLESAHKISVNTKILLCSIAVLFIAFALYILKVNNKHVVEIEQLAFVDELTGIRNMNKFKMDFAAVLQKKESNWAFVIVDIDKMKSVNETFGFESGDILIQDMAKILSAHLNKAELCARVSNDAFFLLLTHDTETKTTKRIHHMLDAILEEFHKRHFVSYNLTFSAGIYVIDKKNETYGTISDKARYIHKRAKEFGKNSVEFYNEEVKDKFIREKEIENQMYDALENNEFLMYVQPKYSLKDEKIVGAEALVRWKLKGDLIAYPDSFIPIFEKNGFVLNLDMYMLDKTCAFLRTQLDNGMTMPPISVNFSRLHLTNATFVSDVKAVLDKWHILPKYIEIELTENTMHENLELLLKVMENFHALGFALAMDDFGTGYSSLGLLKDLPLDVIKLDRSFFTGFVDAERGRTVVKSVISMARKLHIYTVAEGVETKDHVDFLKEIGCDVVQGYYFSKPMPLDDFLRLYTKNVEE